jgi:hypothetical protein
VANAYLSARQPPSWLTVGISPPTLPTLSANLAGVRAVSDDFLRAVVGTNQALTPDGWESDIPEALGHPLYLRDLVDGSYELLTPAPVSGSTPYRSNFVGGDEDFSHVLFETPAVLTSNAPPGGQPKLYQWANGTLSLESVLPDGTPVIGSAGPGHNITAPNTLIDNGISRDGSVIFFSSPANSNGLLYRRENGTTVSVNQPENPEDPSMTPGRAVFRGATPDGSRVFFTSAQQLVAVDDNGSEDLYRYTHSVDPSTDPDNLTLLSRDMEPADGLDALVRGMLGASDDGTRAYFVSDRQIVAGAPAPNPAPSPPQPHIYAWDNGTVRFIATMPTNFSQLFDNTEGQRRMRNVSLDGERLLFVSPDPLTGHPNADTSCDLGAGDRCEQIFLYDLSDQQLVCVSCNPAAAASTADSFLRSETSASPLQEGVTRRNLSADGSRAFFETPEPLVPTDTNGKFDVYMWENGQAHLISTGRSTSNSFFFDASLSGGDVFFTTRERLVGWDQDDLRDVYDARIGGGLPEPPNPIPPCSGDECQGPYAGRPSLLVPGSTLGGHGDRTLGARPNFTVRRLSKKQRAKLASGRRVMLRVRVNRAGKLSVATRMRVDGRARVVDRASKRAAKRGVVNVPLRLSKTALRGLAGADRMRVRVVVRFSKVREPKTLTMTLRRSSAGSSGEGR